MKRLRLSQRCRQPDIHAQLEEQAAAYLVRLYSGELSAAEEQDIARWRATTSEHEEVFCEQQALWLNAMQAEKIAKKRTQPDLQPSDTRGRKQATTGIGALAASLVLVWTIIDWPASSSSAADNPKTASASPVYVPASSDLTEPRRYLMTHAGEVDTMRLSDGSELTLNSATVVEFMFDTDERKVRLLEGEAFFDIVSDPHGQRPFVIISGARRIEVVGTRFNVRARDQRLEVAVLKGQVNLYHQPERRALRKETEDVVTLVAGSFVEIDSSVTPSAADDNTDAMSATAIVSVDEQRVFDAQRWREGVVRLDHVPLKVLVAEFNRYHSDKLHIGDIQAGELPISGVFHLSRDQSLIQALALSLPVRVETDESGRTLYYQP